MLLPLESISSDFDNFVYVFLFQKISPHMGDYCPQKVTYRLLIGDYRP